MPRRLTAQQLALVMAAERKARELQALDVTQIVPLRRERDRLIRQAIAAGVPERTLAERCGMARGMMQKIKRGEER